MSHNLCNNIPAPLYSSPYSPTASTTLFGGWVGGSLFGKEPLRFPKPPKNPPIIASLVTKDRSQPCRLRWPRVGREGLGLAEGGLRGRPRRVAATPCTSRPLIPLKETVRRREKLQKRGQVGRASPPSRGPCLTRTVIMESSTFFVFRFVSEKSEIPPHARNLPRTSVTRQFLGLVWGLPRGDPRVLRAGAEVALIKTLRSSPANRSPTTRSN